MTIADMLGQSGVLTVLGMGIVFGFLIIMIVSITVMGKIIHALGLDKDLAPAKAGSGAPAGGHTAGGNNAAGMAAGNAAVTAAISAAVTEYRKNK